jgi:UDP-N-acetylmuramate-alanine ligase
VEELKLNIGSTDLILIMGAGDIPQVTKKLIEK